MGCVDVGRTLCSLAQLCPLNRMAGGYNPLPLAGNTMGRPNQFSRFAYGEVPYKWVNNPGAGKSCNKALSGGKSGEQRMSACCEAGYKPGPDLITALMSPQQFY